MIAKTSMPTSSVRATQAYVRPMPSVGFIPVNPATKANTTNIAAKKPSRRNPSRKFMSHPF